MNNVISFKDAIERRKKKNEKKVDEPNNVIKNKSFSKSESSFIEEAKKFKFILLSPPGSFVVVNTKNLPEPFPPNPPPPLVA